MIFGSLNTLTTITGLNSMTTFLEPDEINGLTNKVKRPAQVKVLNAMGIEHKVRPDGSVAILRAHITKVFGGSPDSVRKTNKVVEPNWAAI